MRSVLAVVPRLAAFRAPLAPRALAPLARTLATSPPARSREFDRPGPPQLPPEDQAEFERLIKAAQVAPAAAPATDEVFAELEALEHPDRRKGPKPEFEGNVNPKTGEVGGPKQDPFIAGHEDWQFGGRVTDF